MRKHEGDLLTSSDTLFLVATHPSFLSSSQPQLGLEEIFVVVAHRQQMLDALWKYGETLNICIIVEGKEGRGDKECITLTVQKA